MYRFALILILSIPTFAFADTCSVSGTAYDAHGRPTRGVVRLIDLQTQQAALSNTDGMRPIRSIRPWPVTAHTAST